MVRCCRSTTPMYFTITSYWGLSSLSKLLNSQLIFPKSHKSVSNLCFNASSRPFVKPITGRTPIYPGRLLRRRATCRVAGLRGRSFGHIQRGNTATATLQPQPSSQRKGSDSTYSRSPGSFDEVLWEPSARRIPGSLWTMQKKTLAAVCRWPFLFTL